MNREKKPFQESACDLSVWFSFEKLFSKVFPVPILYSKLCPSLCSLFPVLKIVWANLKN